MISRLEVKDIGVLDSLRGRRELEAYFLSRATGLKWFEELDRRGYFDPRDNPEPREGDKPGYYSIPFWPALAYLEAVAPEFRSTDGALLLGRLLQILRDITHRSTDEARHNWRTWFSLAKILAELPIDRLAAADIDLSDKWLNSRFDASIVADELGRQLFPALLRGRPDLALRLLEILTRLRQGDRDLLGQPQRSFRFDGWIARKILIENASRIALSLGRDGIELLARRLSELFAGSQLDRLSTIWRPAIEDHEQNDLRGDEPAHILVSTLRDACEALGDERFSELEPLPAAFLASELITLKRIAIHLSQRFFPALHGLARAVLTHEFLTDDYRHEIYRLLEERFSDLSKPDQARLLTTIEGLPLDSIGDPRADDLRAAYWRLTWLSALRDSENAEARRLFEKYLEMVGEEPEHPEFSSYGESGFVSEQSPAELEDLLARNTEDLLAYIGSYVETPSLRGPSARGLAEVVREAVKREPQKFASHLREFAQLDFVYSYEILKGFRDVLQTGAVGWPQVLDFCAALLSREDLWARSPTAKTPMEATPRWVTGELARFFRDAAKGENLEPADSDIARIEELNEILLTSEPSSDDGGSKEALTAAINSPYGVALEALFYLARRAATKEDAASRNHRITWRRVRATFDRELHRSYHEFHALAGAYALLLLYLDRDWFLEALERIFPLDAESRWRAAMDGYSFVGTVHELVYRRLSDGSHLLRALDDSELRDHVAKRVIENAAIGFVAGWERIEEGGGLAATIVSRGQSEEIEHLVWFIWRMHSDRSEGVRTAALRLWHELVGRGRVPSNLSLFAVFLDDLDRDSFALLSAAVAGIQGTHTFSVVNELERLAATSPREVGMIFSTLVSKAWPTHPKEAIERIVEGVWKSGSRDIAESIFDQYFERQEYWLQETRQKLRTGH
jgi:hypothetical protein